jgi:hypothetical protein
MLTLRMLRALLAARRRRWRRRWECAARAALRVRPPRAVAWVLAVVATAATAATAP